MACYFEVEAIVPHVYKDITSIKRSGMLKLAKNTNAKEKLVDIFFFRVYLRTRRMRER